MSLPVEKILKGQSTPEEFILFVEDQIQIATLQELDWSQTPIWQTFLSTSPSDAQLHQFMVTYKKVGGDLLQPNRYQQNLFATRLERATNSYALNLEVVLQTFSFTQNLSAVEEDYKALWSFCLKEELSEAEQITALQHYQEAGGNLQFKAGYGSILKYIAEIPSMPLWERINSWGAFTIEEEFVVGSGDGEKRMEFCQLLVKQNISITLWGELTAIYALRDNDLVLFKQLIDWGWSLDLSNPDFLDKAKSVEAFQLLINLGIPIEPVKSNYPFDFPLYKVIYNLAGHLQDHQKSSNSSYSKSIQKGKEKLMLLLQKGARLNPVLNYERTYLSFAQFFHKYPEIYAVVKEHGHPTDQQFIAIEIEQLKEANKNGEET
ncbi:MAG: hypothetical protein ACRBFS_22725 [Aureispira sp.]